MRLIDADALLAKTVKKNSIWKSITNSEGKNLEEIVSELPSVNPQEPKCDRLYDWLNDMRYGIAPDENTPDDERREREAQVDVIDDIMEWIEKHPQEPKTGWNNHQIACMLADLFGNACACNYNGIDEWLPEVCDFKDTCCPNPVGVACWEQFLKHYQNHKGSDTE